MFKKVKGFQDIYGEDCAYWSRAEEAVVYVTELFNLEQIRTPILEMTSLFKRGIGDTTDIVEKEMFTFTDLDGDSLSMRPENTAGVVRAYVENGLYNQAALRKYCYYGPMFRRENPQKGRFRQFTQYGVEFLGTSSPLADADVINILVTFYDKLGLADYTHLEINSIGCPKCRPAYHKKLVEYFTAHKGEMCEDCNRRLERNPLRILDCKVKTCRPIIDKAPLIIEHLCDECSEHFEAVKGYLKLLNVEYKINPLMVRGLDYYVRTAFEVVTDKLGAASAVGAGGRYDGLVETLGGPATPGVGFAIGVDRAVALLKMKSEIALNSPSVYIITFGGETLSAGVQLLAELRKKGIVADIDYDVKGMKNQMKKADRSGAKYAIIIGEDELKDNKVTLRNLGDSTQELVAVEGLAERL